MTNNPLLATIDRDYRLQDAAASAELTRHFVSPLNALRCRRHDDGMCAIHPITEAPRKEWWARRASSTMTSDT
jgi:hypothetical protein